MKLLLPKEYVNSNELMDINGGWNYTEKGYGKGLAVPYSKIFMNKSKSLKFANYVIETYGSGYMGGMSAWEINEEVFAHAALYIATSSVKTVLAAAGISSSQINSWYNSAKVADIGGYDSRKSWFHLIYTVVIGNPLA